MKVRFTRHSHVHSCKDGRNTTVLGEPIRHDKTLKTQLVLQDSVLQPRVLTRMRVVDTVIRAHDSADTGLDRVLEGPQVDLVKCSVIDV